MKKWIRLPGIIIFLVVVALISIFWFIFADSLIKKGIETAGSRAVGAKVELADADLSLFPLGLDLTGLQVTNPDELMTNIVEIEQIRLTMETLYLLQRKVVSDEMILAGVRFNTPRKVSGKLPDKPAKEKAKEKEKSAKKKSSSIELPKLSVTSVDDILKKEKLKTVAEVEQFKKDIQAEQENYKNLLKTLPDKKKLQSYQDRIKKLKGSKSLGSLFGAADEVKTIQKEIENDLNRLKNTKGDLQGKVAAYKKRLVHLKDLPKEDFNRLKEKYSLSSKGIGNMALLLFGPKYADYVTKGISLYEKAKPFLSSSSESAPDKVEETTPERGEGIDVKFKEEHPIPDLLIRIAKVSVAMEAGEIKGDVMNISSDQTIYGKPITFRFLGEKLKDVKGVGIQGSLDRTRLAQAVDKIYGTISGYQISNASLSTDSELPIALEKALADIQLDIQVKNQQIDSNVVSNLNSVVFKTEASKENDPLQTAIRDALSGISKFQVKAALTGTLEKNDVKVDSDIDKVMGAAVKNAVKNQAKVFEKKLKQQLTEKTGGMLNGLDSSLGDFNFIDKELTDRLNVGDGLLGDLNLF